MPVSHYAVDNDYGMGWDASVRSIGVRFRGLVDRHDLYPPNGFHYMSSSVRGVTDITEDYGGSCCVL